MGFCLHSIKKTGCIKEVAIHQVALYLIISVNQMFPVLQEFHTLAAPEGFHLHRQAESLLLSWLNFSKAYNMVMFLTCKHHNIIIHSNPIILNMLFVIVIIT